MSIVMNNKKTYLKKHDLLVRQTKDAVRSGIVTDTSSSTGFYLDCDTGEVKKVPQATPFFIKGNPFGLGNLGLTAFTKKVEMLSDPMDPGEWTPTGGSVTETGNIIGDFVEYNVLGDGYTYNGVFIYKSTESGNPTGKQQISLLYNIGDSGDGRLHIKDETAGTYTNLYYTETGWYESGASGNPGTVEIIIDTALSCGVGLICFSVEWTTPANSLSIRATPNTSLTTEGFLVYGANVYEKDHCMFPIFSPGSYFPDGVELFAGFTILGDGWTDNGDGTYSCDGTQTGWSSLQAPILTIGDHFQGKYKATITSGNIRLWMGNTTAGTKYTISGAYEERLTCAGNNNLLLEASVDFVGTIEFDSLQKMDPITNSIYPRVGTSKLQDLSNHFPGFYDALRGSVKSVDEFPEYSFARDSDKNTVTDFEGTVHTCKENEIRQPLKRRVENLLDDSEDFSQSDWTPTDVNVVDNGDGSYRISATANLALLRQAVTVVDGDKTEYVNSIEIKRVTGSGTIELADADLTFIAVTVTDEWERVEIPKSIGQTTTANFRIRIVVSGDEIDIRKAQLEKVTGSQTSASEYVSTGVSVQTVGDNKWSTPTTLGAGWTDNGDGTYSYDGTDATNRLIQTGPIKVGRWYKFDIEIVEYTQGAIGISDGTTTFVSGLKTVGATTVFFLATDTDISIAPEKFGGFRFIGKIGNISALQEAYHGANVDGVKYFDTDRDGVKIGTFDTTSQMFVQTDINSTPYDEVSGVEFDDTSTGPISQILSDGTLHTTAAGEPLVVEGRGFTSLGAVGNEFPAADYATMMNFTTQGTANVGVGEISGPFGGVADVATVGTVGNAIYKLFGALTADTPVDTVLAIYKVSETGIVEITNPYSSTAGFWEVDLSGLPAGWSWLYDQSPYVTVNTAFKVASNGSVGMGFRASIGTLSFGAYGFQQVVGSKAWPVIISGGTLTATRSGTTSLSLDPDTGATRAREAFEGSTFGNPILSTGNLDSGEMYEVVTTETDHFGSGVVAGDRVSGLTTALDANNTVRLVGDASFVLTGEFTPGVGADEVANGTYINVFTSNDRSYRWAYLYKTAAGESRLYFHDGTDACYVVLNWQADTAYEFAIRIGYNESESARKKQILVREKGTTTWTESALSDVVDHLPISSAEKLIVGYGTSHMISVDNLELSLIDSVPGWSSTPFNKLKGYQCEKESTNLLADNEGLSIGWSTLGLNVTLDQIIAPNGELKASLVECSANGDSYITQTVSVTSGNNYTQSVIAKKGTTDYISLTLGTAGFGSAQRAIFDLSSGTIDTEQGGNATIKALYDGFYTCSFTATATATTSTAGALITPSRSGAGRFQGVSGDNVYIWRPQTEESSFPTSLIKTETTTVTRSADELTIDNTGNAILPNSFSMVLETIPAADGGDYATNAVRLFGSDDASGSSDEVRTDNSANYGYVPLTGGGSFLLKEGDITADTELKYGFQLYQDGVNSVAKIFLNGELKHSETNVQIIDHSDLALNIGHWGGYHYTGIINYVGTSPDFISEADMLDFTSLDKDLLSHFPGKVFDYRNSIFPVNQTVSKASGVIEGIFVPAISADDTPNSTIIKLIKTGASTNYRDILQLTKDSSGVKQLQVYDGVSICSINGFDWQAGTPYRFKIVFGWHKASLAWKMQLFVKEADSVTWTYSDLVNFEKKWPISEDDLVYCYDTDYMISIGDIQVLAVDTEAGWASVGDILPEGYTYLIDNGGTQIITDDGEDLYTKE